MFASSEHVWDPMASSSATFCLKTRTAPLHESWIDQNATKKRLMIIEASPPPAAETTVFTSTNAAVAASCRSVILPTEPPLNPRNPIINIIVPSVGCDMIDGGKGQ
jgi:hypothetical protein